MAAPVNPPRGMRDLLPAEKATREHALSVIRAVYRSHGFDEIEAPALEEYGYSGGAPYAAFGVAVAAMQGFGRE